MAQGTAILDLTFPATDDFSSKLYTLVKKDTSGRAVTACGDGDPVFGILQNHPKAGDAAIVRVEGSSPVLVGTGGYNEGDLLAADADGAATTADSGDYTFGVAVEAGTDGTLATALIQRNGKV